MSETTISPRMRARGLPTAAGAAGRALAGRRAAGERRGVVAVRAAGREVVFFAAGRLGAAFFAVVFLAVAFLAVAFLAVAFGAGRC